MRACCPPGLLCLEREKLCIFKTLIGAGHSSTTVASALLLGDDYQPQVHCLGQ